MERGAAAFWISSVSASLRGVLPMVVHVTTVTSVSARAESWEAAVLARPEAEADALLPGHRVAAAAVALVALTIVAVPVLLAVALLVDPGGFARAFS